MTEALRQLLESYDGIAPPIRVQTDLSAARSPSYAIAKKGERISCEDVLGRKSYTATFALHMRRVASGEKDRQGAHEFLHRLGEWLTTQSGITAGRRSITRIEVGSETLQEAYDDGTAAWSMEIRLLCEDILKGEDRI